MLPHHGSLSRKLRLTAEEKLKNGELRAVVATASLELGIDIGTVDLVCQVGSPRSIAVALQRFGRSGHWVGATPKARLFATTRDELIECAALMRAIRQGELDRLEIPDSPLDVLAQQIIAETACEEWGEDELFERFASTYAYRGLTRQRFDSVVEMLSEGISTRARAQRGVSASRPGQPPPARAPQRAAGGDYFRRSDSRYGAVSRRRRAGGLGGGLARRGLRGREHGRRYFSAGDDVRGASGASSRAWCGSRTLTGPPRRFLSGAARRRAARSSFRARFRGCARISRPGSTGRLLNPGRRTERSRPKAGRPLPDFLLEQCRLDRPGAEQAVAYVQAGRRALGVVPSQQTVVAERFFDESGGMQLIIHAPFGSRINRAWGLSLRKRFCRSFNLELQAAATDNGINISLTEQHAFPLEMVFEFLRPADA